LQAFYCPVCTGWFYCRHFIVQCALDGSIAGILLSSVHWMVLLQAFYCPVCTGWFCCRHFIVQCALDGSIAGISLSSVHWMVLLQAFHCPVCTGWFYCRHFIVQCALDGSIAGVLLFTVHEDGEWPVTLIIGRYQRKYSVTVKPLHLSVSCALIHST